jgi:hypothetical protein
MLLPAKLPQCPVSQLEIPTTLPLLLLPIQRFLFVLPTQSTVPKRSKWRQRKDHFGEALGGSTGGWTGKGSQTVWLYIQEGCVARVFAPITPQYFMQMKDCVCTNHRSFAEPPGKMLSPPA